MSTCLDYRRVAEQELDNSSLDKELFESCLKHASDNKERARIIYIHRRIAELEKKKPNLDQNEKWPMLIPLLILYTLGTIGVLCLVFVFLANRLGWW
jgi:hypothetical protein